MFFDFLHYLSIIIFYIIIINLFIRISHSLVNGYFLTFNIEDIDLKNGKSVDIITLTNLSKQTDINLALCNVVLEYLKDVYPHNRDIFLSIVIFNYITNKNLYLPISDGCVFNLNDCCQGAPDIFFNKIKWQDTSIPMNNKSKIVIIVKSL